MFKIKFIKNPPTIEDLMVLYESDVYQTLLDEYSKRARYKLDSRPEDEMSIIKSLANAQRNYLILNIPFEEVLSEFEMRKEDLLKYSIIKINFFNNLDNNCTDGEFPEGEEPDKDDKWEVIETLGICKSFFFNNFCELYLLNTGDKERLLHFLKTIRMPYAKKYAGQITKLYKQIWKNIV